MKNFTGAEKKENFPIVYVRTADENLERGHQLLQEFPDQPLLSFAYDPHALNRMDLEHWQCQCDAAPRRLGDLMHICMRQRTTSLQRLCEIKAIEHITAVTWHVACQRPLMLVAC